MKSVQRSIAQCAVVLASGLAATLHAQNSFNEIAQSAGIVHEHIPGFDQFGWAPLPNAMMRDWCQSGIAVGDLDLDGDPDVVLCGSLTPPAVYRNDGSSFVDVTASANLESSEFYRVPALGDYDRDGDLDLFIGALDGGQGPTPGKSRLYRNEGGLVFSDVTSLAGTIGNGHTTYAKWLDLDMDGLADLLTGEFHVTPNLWYRNNGDGTFSELGAAMGLDVGGSTHVLTAFDSDEDGALDVFVGNDYLASAAIGYPDNLGDVHLARQADGTYLDVSAGSGFDHMQGIMGFAVGDVNVDGLVDIYKSNAGQNKLALNHAWPSGTPWTDAETIYGIPVAVLPDINNPGLTGSAISWGATFTDFNLDGWNDLYCVNGMIPNGMSVRSEQNFFMLNGGPARGYRFRDRTAQVGLLDNYDDRALAPCDVNLDGRMDMFVGPVAGFTRLFINNLNVGTRGWLAVKPVANTSQPFGTGVRAWWLDTVGREHQDIVDVEAPTASQGEIMAYFGTGPLASVDLNVRFPSGITLSLPATAKNQVVRPVEPELIRLSRRTAPIGSGSITVTAFAHDSSGAALGASATVAIDVPGLSPTGPVQNVSGNEFLRSFAAPAVQGSFAVSVDFDGFAVAIHPQVHFFDPSDASGTRLQADAWAVRAGSDDRIRVEVAPRTAQGIGLGTGLTVAGDLGGVAPLTGTLDLGDGRYELLFAAPPQTGIHALSVSVGGSPVPASLLIEAAGSADFAATGISSEDTTSVNSPWIDRVKLAITPRDGAGLRLGPAADVELVPIPDAGTAALAVHTNTNKPQVDGDFIFVADKAPGSSGAASGVFELRVDGGLLGTIPYAF